MSKYYVATPIYYVNDSPHIGHAYTTTAADFIARFMRLDGKKVLFLTGTDEHGLKIQKAAQKAEMEPQAFTDLVSQRFRDLNRVMNFTEDDFIRTSAKRHKDYVSTIWQRLVDNGHIYLDKYAGWYAVRDEAFYAEDELVDGKAPTGAEVEWVEEPSYFFRLSNFQDKLLQLYEDQPDFILPKSRRNEVLSFVKAGLQDLSVSRTSFSWGIPVPGASGHVMYVWLDALFFYLSSLEDKEKSEFWPCDLHIVGKDILRFHAVYWPAFLMAAGIEVPHRVFAHGWWTNNGEKISKSLGNVINPLELVKEFGVDYIRYFMLREVPFGNDGNYSRTALVNRINAELANNIGNLMQRVTSFVHAHNNGIIPQCSTIQPEDRVLLEQAYSLIDKMRQEMETQGLNLAIGHVVELGNAANEYVSRNPFWELRKTDNARMQTVLYVLLETMRIIGIALQPIVPDSATKLLAQLEVKQSSFADASADKKLISGQQLVPPTPVFMRIQ
ncbi:MAG: methionine--tRNA ligase [Proteobacteria bacterium]|nr:methionine--tRNA ligase [Pseudomonadota bacterium]